jgi:hypothetical protein
MCNSTVFEELTKQESDGKPGQENITTCSSANSEKVADNTGNTSLVINADRTI